ncbi:MAG: glycosyltransferase [bacterium]|nr:glycosyltransferase [bacterium]
MKKILYVITKSNWGGAQRYVFDLATNLPKDAFEVSVVFGGSGLLTLKLQEAGTMIYHSESLGRDVSIGKDIKSFFELYRLFKKIRPDIVHLNSSKAGGLGALAARIAGVKKIIFTAHGWPFREQRIILVGGTVWLASWFTALLSTKVICVSNYDLGQARQMPFIGHKTIRIYNGIDQAMVFESGDIIRNAFPTGVKITGTVGELTKNKNQQALIEEAKQNSTLYVAIVGEGEERAALEKKIKEYRLENRVKLFGFMPAAEVLKGLDTFALSSIKEGLPYVLLEARVAGLPIVANRVGGIPEALDVDLKEFSLERMLEKTLALYQTSRQG